MRNATLSTAAASCCCSSSSSSPASGYHLVRQRVFGSSSLQGPSHGGGGGRLAVTSTAAAVYARRPPAMEELGAPAVKPLLLQGLASLNLFLLLLYLLLLLLAKLFARLRLTTASSSKNTTSTTITTSRDDRRHGRCDGELLFSGRGEDADMAGGQLRRPEQDTLFWFDEAVFEESRLLNDEGKDHSLYSNSNSPAAAHCLQLPVQSRATFPLEEYSTTDRRRITFSSPSPTPRRDAAAAATTGQKEQEEEAKGDDVVVPTAPPGQQQDIPVVVASPENVSLPADKESSRGGQDGRRGDDGRDEHGEADEEEEEKAAAGCQEEDHHHHHVKLFVNSRALADTKELLLDQGAMVAGGGRPPQEKDKHEDSSRFGASTLTSESTSKSSVEWQSSTTAAVTKDWDFSSSSRRSSARWESYTLFRKYDEDMVYFHRVGAQKLTETESFRSIKYQPRSMSARLAHSLAPKPASAPAIGLRDPYPELERVYVAQICLTWEALNWNYTSFQRHNGGGGGEMMMEARCCPARVAQEFQQFQVLLYRFIENEPYEYGRRPEVYARMKNSSPKLLLVPEFREEEDEKDDLISAVQFLHIMEESIRTFMAFLRADKRSHYQMFREMVMRRRSAADQSLVLALKKSNQKKKRRLKDLTRPRRCLRRTKVRESEEVSMLLGLIDLKVVARVLRMPEISDQQLLWCEEKMKRLHVDVHAGSMQRDPSPLFFPAH